MESEGGKRERGNSNRFATTNDRPNPPNNNDGGNITSPPGRPDSPENNDGVTMGDSQVDGARPQGLDMLAESQEQIYGIQSQKNQEFANCPPRDDRLFQCNSIIPHAESTATQSAILEPPVTKATLSELDVTKIVHNPKLRHDINFDPDLHFRPNLDGEKGRRKTQKANHFWETLREQLLQYLQDREQFESQLGDAEWTLPTTLKAIRGILETLVPQRDRASVEETFNVDLLMQQFRMGVADLQKLATWLCRLLKCHCAPMRDDWVDEMVTQLSNGQQNGDVDLLVAGMRNLLGVLEAMKLDVANHQIRCLRPLLIEDTVNFEQKFFMKKIAMRKVAVAGAHAWYTAANSLPDIAPLDSSLRLQNGMLTFMKALVNLVLPSRAEVIPHTFLFDEERLIKLRSDVLELTNFEIVMHLFRSLEAQNRLETRHSTRDDTPTMSFTSSPFCRPASPADNTMLSSPTIPFPHHFTPRPKHASQERGYFIRTGSGKQIWVPSVENDYAASSAASSPESSPSSTASTPETNPPTPLYLSQPVPESNTQARASFQAILSSLTTSDKWNTLAPSLALETLRLTNTPLTRLPHFESHLAFHISNPASRLYQEAELHVLSQMFPILQRLVVTFTPLTSLQIFEAATSPKTSPGRPRPQTNGVKDEVTDVTTRIAHIGVLHWRVWALLAYLVDPDAESESNPLT